MPDAPAEAAVNPDKPITDQPAILSNLALANVIANVNLSQQNAIANQQALNELGISIVGKTVNLITNLGPLEAKSAEELLTGNSLAETIADLKATLAAFGHTAAPAASLPAAPAASLPAATTPGA